MKAVILAGGLGTRLAEETEVRPKPMVEIGGLPLIWHIMKIYSSHGIRDFVVALGYKGEHIKRFFLDYSAMGTSLRVSTADGSVEYLGNTLEQEMEDWIREIIREEIVNYNNVFMSRFGVDKDGVVHLTKGTKLN